MHAAVVLARVATRAIMGVLNFIFRDLMELKVQQYCWILSFLNNNSESEGYVTFA